MKLPPLTKEEYRGYLCPLSATPEQKEACAVAEIIRFAAMMNARWEVEKI
jgi:hypothetical protein